MIAAMETTNARWRVWVGGLFWLPYAFGYALLTPVALLLRDWRLMHAAITAPTALIFAYYWYTIIVTPELLFLQSPNLERGGRIFFGEH